MDVPDKSMGHLKDKVRHELIEYAVNVVYLTLVFEAFTQYRRLVLAPYNITDTNYWFAAIQALVLGKVIMIGTVFGLGRRLEDKPLIYPTLYKTAVFVVFVGVFKIVEHGIKGIWNGEGLAGALVDVSWKGSDVVLANGLAVLVAFIPFFAIKELGRVFGSDKIFAPFFQRKYAK
jgi:hypothetical protein